MTRLLTLGLAVLLSACTAQVKITGDTAPPPEPSPITWTDCSQNMGDHPCDMTLSDQHAQAWSLYEGWGNIQVLDFSTGWCGYCNASGSTLQSIQDEYTPWGVQFITVLIEDTNIYSCSTLTARVADRDITTVEGLESEDGTLHPVQQAHDVEHALHARHRHSKWRPI